MRIMLTFIFGAFMIACIGAIGFRILYSVNGYGKQPINLRTDTIPVKRNEIPTTAIGTISIESDNYYSDPFKKIIIQQPDRSFCIITILGDKIGHVYYSDSIPAYDSIWILYQFTDPRLNGKTPNKRYIGAWINSPQK